MAHRSAELGYAAAQVYRGCSVNKCLMRLMIAALRMVYLSFMLLLLERGVRLRVFRAHKHSSGVMDACMSAARRRVSPRLCNS